MEAGKVINLRNDIKKKKFKKIQNLKFVFSKSNGKKVRRPKEKKGMKIVTRNEIIISD